MNIFDLTLRLNGFPVAKAKKLLQQIHAIDENDYKAYTSSQKKALVSFHLKENRFYRNFAKHIDLSHWDSIPVMRKKELQQPLKQRISKGFRTKNIYINKTSGSSGDPFIFAKDKFAHALTWAIIQDRFSWYNLDFNRSLQARFYGIPLDKKGYFKERIKDVFSKRFRFSVFDLSDEALDKVLQAFKKHSFSYLNGYTSAIVLFAKYLQKKQLVLRDVCPTLTCCIVTSEMLFPEDKKLLETQLGVPVINEYGASELDLIAFQNPEGLWQVNSESLYVEILDENNTVLPYGEEGRIVITSLYNKAHPFIRYDIGDIGKLSTKSTAKVPILEKLTGRTNDLVILPGGKKAAGLTFYYITKSIIEEDGNVKEFVIEQHDYTTFKVIYVSRQILTEKKLAQIKHQMENYLEPGLTIYFERVDSLTRSKSGKLKQFSSLINHP